MKVLHFYKTSLHDSYGGIEQAISQIARGCNRLGVESEVLSLSSKISSPSVIDSDGYLNHLAKLDFQIASTSFSFSAIRQFTELANKADIIHYHFPWPFMDFVHFYSSVKKSSVVTYHSDIIRQKYLLKLYCPLKRKFLSNVNHIVASSPNYLVTSDILQKFKDKVSVIPLGLDKSSYPIPTSERLDYWKKKFRSKFFLFVGVIRYYKGLHILVEASKGINCPVVIVGVGPIEHELKEQAIRLGLKNVHFLGEVSDEDKVALLMLSYAVVFPSYMRSEAFGISLLEGAMYGKPMISSEIGTGTSFINIHNETGLVVRANDVQGFRGAMNYLLEHPNQVAEMGRRGMKRYQQFFTADNMVKSYVDLYKNLV